MRGAIVLLLIAAWAAPPPFIHEPEPIHNDRVVVLDPPQQVQTVDPRVCMHTRLTDEVETYKIQETLRLVRRMGASTIVDFLPWAYIERERGVYDWYHPDRIVEHANNQGLRIIARLGLVPSWAQQDADVDTPTLNYLPESEFESFARFVGAFVERYERRVDHIIIWNEPNLDFEWGGRPPDPVAYTRLLRLSYEAAKAANPDVVVISAGLAPTLAMPGMGQGGWQDLDYLAQMYEAGAADYFDVLAVHNYPFNNPPQAEPAEDILNFRRVELIREVMLDYGDVDKPVYITETGWNDSPRYTYGVRPAERIAYTLEMYDFTQEAYPWLEMICLWHFRLPAPTNHYYDYFTYVSTDFQIKPIYEAVQAYAHGWQADER